ncbi:DUF1127 domain-containing protein [Roseovarius sp. 2305UL8-3]|uniref:DUF1127 domain-containing protein n=1 Tax=Roseovarius conchicola TaxID=3121636 RepID=UPI0035283678
MTFLTNTHSASCRGSAPRRFSLMTLFSIARERRALSQLNADQLRDIGVSAHNAEAEARRPIWDAPDMWLR